MERTQIADAIQAIIAEQISKPQQSIDENASLESLGMDSLDRVEVVMKIEEKFNVEMSDERVDAINTVRELIDYVDSLKK